MKQSTKEWINAAEDDLNTIERLITDSSLTNIMAFHAQQAIEKALKAIIEEFSLGSIKTHNLQTLLSKIEELQTLRYDEYIIAEIDRLYIDARYPGDFGLMPFGKPTLIEASDYYQQAKVIKQQVEVIVSKR